MPIQQKHCFEGCNRLWDAKLLCPPIVQSVSPMMMNRRRRIVRTVVGAGCTVGFLVLGLSCYKETHTYLVCVKPEPQEFTYDGRAQLLSQEGCFVMRELWGTHMIVVRHKDTSSVRVAVFPRWSDDNSSSLFIEKDKVTSHGDLRYEILQK